MKLLMTRGGEDTMKERTVAGFGARLAEIRQRRGLTQEALGTAVGVSNRVVAYYEGHTAQPPGAMLADLARALTVSADELLGLTPMTAKQPPKTARLLKRLQKVAELPAADQRTVLKLVDALHDAQRRTARPTRKARAAS